MTGSAKAFGFSITITVTYGVVNAAQGNPTRWELLGFAMTAVTAFFALNLLVAAVMRHEPDYGTPQRALLIGTSTDFLAAAAAVGAAIGTTVLVTGWPVWLLAPLLAALAYVLVQSVELAVGRDETDKS